MLDTPRSLEQWLAALEPLQLPLGTELRASALAAIDGGCSAAALAAALLDDPAAVLLVFREANRALARYEREAHGLEHALGLLGMARVRALLQQAPVLSIEHPFTREYRQAQQRSLHAAWQARLWAEGTGRWPGDELFWDTLLAGAAHWALWLEAGSLRLRLSKLRAQRGFVTPQESLALFGCDLNVLMQELTARWSLPRNSQLSWRRDAIGGRRDWIGLARAARLDEAPALPAGRLSELAHQPALIVALANLLAVEADWDWDGRHCERLLKIAASCCRRPLATVVNFVHQTAAIFSRAYRGDLQTPAARLLCHWRQAQTWAAESGSAAPAAAPAPAPAPGGQAAPAPAGLQQFAAAVRQLQQPQALPNMRAALTLALDAAHAGLGLRRVAALLYRAPQRELQVLLRRGDADPLPPLRLPVAADSLLAQILHQPVCVRLGADNAARYLPRLPPALRDAIGGDALLASLSVGGQPLALLFADNAGAAIDAAQHQRFRQLGALLGQCLERIGRPGQSR